MAKRYFRTLMASLIRPATVAAAIFALSSPAYSQSYPDAKAVVTVGGPVTEIVYALGEQDRIVARDTTSVYPPEANQLPDVGYMRRLSPEGVLSVNPDLIIARDTSGPPETMDLLKAASVPVVLTRDGFSPDAVLASIRTVGEALGVQEKANALATDVEGDLARLAERVEALEKRRKVMFVFSLRGGRMNVAGRDTGANGIIEMAGGDNVMASSFTGYKLVDAEAVISAAPDLIVMMEGRGNHRVSSDDLFNLPQMKLTPAGENRAFVTVPGAALGFGPRAAEFGNQLFDLMYENAR